MSSPAESSNEHSLTLHAEYLPNIRQITLYVTLPASQQANPPNPTISLSESRRAVTVSIAGDTAEDDADAVSETIKLPARVHETSRRVLESATTTSQNSDERQQQQRELSFRMQVDPEDALHLNISSDDDIVGNRYAPWMAGDMGPTTKARCRACGSVVLDVPAAATADATGWVWKDLPSGNWAEMMDFWHCHKPDTHDHEKDPEGKTVSIQERNSQVRGYGAANQVVAKPGTVLVDVPSFLVIEEDCKGVQKASDTSSRLSSRSITCTSCESLVGIEDPIANGYRLLKAALSVSTPSQYTENSDSSTWETHPTETVVAAQLLELVERESARRFGVHCGGENGLLLWVFNPSLHTSTASKAHTVPPHRAMKVLYQEVANITTMLNPETGNLSSLSLEELELPSGIFSTLRDALEKSNHSLPGSARWFREWKVGVLGRYDRTV